MKHSKHEKPRNRKAGKAARICLLSLFGMTFVVGAYMSSRILLERRCAADAYEGLRLEAQLSIVAVNKAPPADVSDKQEQIAEGDTSDVPTYDAADAEIVVDMAQVPLVSMDFVPLREQCPNIRAWLFAEGTSIDYPVVQTDNNNYFLTRLYNGDNNSSGSIFIDYRNTGLFTDQNTVIYGHHMQNGSMFGSLKLYKGQDFYDEYPTMLLYTPDGDYQIELICGTVEDGNYEFVRFDFEDEEDFLSYIESRRSRSTFQSNVKVGPDDRIVSLCTCSYEWNNARYMLIGKLTPILTDPTEYERLESAGGK